MRPCLLSHMQIVGCVCLLCCCQLSRCLQALASIFADGLQQLEAWLLLLLLGLLDQALVQERGHSFQYIHPRFTLTLVDCFGCFKCATSYKDREPAEEVLLLVGE